MVALVQSQEQETTTDQRVERDVDMQSMPQMPGFPGEIIPNMVKTYTDAVGTVIGTMKEMIPTGSSANVNTARRRRTPQQNPQPPNPQKPPMAQA